MPTITNIPQAARGTIVRRFRVGPYTAHLEKNLRVQRGPVRYEYILAAIDRRIRQITFFVTSELNTANETLGGGSHFLCMFIDNDHVNFGASDDWADLEMFEAAAVKLIKQVIAREKQNPPSQPAAGA